MSYDEDCDTHDPAPACPAVKPTDSSLGIYSANGHVIYHTDGTVSVALVDKELREIWRCEAEPHGVGFKQFKTELEALAKPIMTDATMVTRPVQDQLATLPGNVRLRHLRFCLCWRWICIYVWIRI